MIKPEHWQKFGLLFGCLEPALGFGVLSMSKTSTDAVGYRWVIPVDDKNYYLLRCVSIHEMNPNMSIPDYANVIAKTMRDEAKYTVEAYEKEQKLAVEQKKERG